MRAARGILYFCVSLLAACAGAENEVLRKFFLAVNTEDQGTLAGISRVALREKVDQWEVVDVLAESTEPFSLPLLRKERFEVATTRDSRYMVYNRFRNEHYEELKQIESRLAEDPDYEFSGRLAEVQREWQEFRREQQELKATLDALDMTIEPETILAKLSLVPEMNVETLSGEVQNKEVLVRITYVGGETKEHVFTLKKYLLRPSDAESPALSRWIIAAIEPRNG